MASAVEPGVRRCPSLKSGDPALQFPVHGLPQDAIRLLQSLALKLWSDLHLQAKDLVVRPLKGALTNQVYECCWDPLHASSSDQAEEEKESAHSKEGGGKTNGKLRKLGRSSTRRVLVRVYGEGVDIFFNREDEIRTFEAMSRAGQGPCLLGRFPNGRVEEFLHARTLSAVDLQNPEIRMKIAKKLREFHQLSIPGTRKPWLWKRLSDWLQKALTLCSPEHVEEFHLQTFGHELEELRTRIVRPGSEIGFCHNDLQYGNIMMDEVDDSLTLIDYEYSSYNPVAYDLGNFFCEMAADYHTETPHVLDYSKCPDFEEKCKFITTYLTSSSEKPVSRSEIEKLSRETEEYALASHIHWGLWGIISAYVNEIDFDYLEYARQRFQQYHISKAQLMTSL